MQENHLSIVENAWKKVNKESTVWDNLEIKDSSFCYNLNLEHVFLSSFKRDSLPFSPYSLTTLGKVLTRLSTFANIMSRRPGTEEVTFYALLNSPHSGLLGKIVDRKMLQVAAPPLVWRREQIIKQIKNKLEEYTKANQSFLFLDIGCGAGFDSLEIERSINRINDLTDNSFDQKYMSINIDTDSLWLKNNKILSEHLFGSSKHVIRKNISIFSFLLEEKYKLYLNQYDNLIISCNGFAEFLTDTELKKLYEGIFDFTKLFTGNIHIMLPFANKNKEQEMLGKKIGFYFRAKEKEDIICMIEEIFTDHSISYTEKHSQIVLTIEK